MLLQKKLVYLLAVPCLVILSFVAGFVACLHLKSTSPETVRRQNLLTPGDANPVIRAAALQSLNQLQNDYSRRDPAQLPALVHSLLPADGDLLILGTDTGEWIRGSSNAAQFIAADWRSWGDLHLDVDDAIVWSSGDIAWLATIGNVNFGKRVRPLRFTAVLARENNRWVFRQMHFQWDDKDPIRRDLLRPGSYRRLLNGETY